MQTAKNMKSLGYVADMRGAIPESWACVDCGINTAPGCLNRARMEQALAADWNNKGITNTFCGRSEVYRVKPPVWKAASMQDQGGCLCIGCLENRLGRTLVWRDFDRKHPFSKIPGTARLLSRRTVYFGDDIVFAEAMGYVALPS
jgi:hypothetical protein